jgi:hypothetical protein
MFRQRYDEPASVHPHVFAPTRSCPPSNCKKKGLIDSKTFSGIADHIQSETVPDFHHRSAQETYTSCEKDKPDVRFTSYRLALASIAMAQARVP